MNEVLRDRVTDYLCGHYTMTIATAGAAGNEPHAASVFYAVDNQLRLVFLSRPASVHGTHIGEAAPVAVTVTEHYEDWEVIKGVQLWGEARLLGGAAKAKPSPCTCAASFRARSGLPSWNGRSDQRDRCLSCDSAKDRIDRQHHRSLWPPDA